MQKQAVILIPFYKEELTYNEEFSLKQCFDILADHPIIAIKPASLDLSFVTDKYHFTATTSFEDYYFKNINGYNELMLTASFYEAFLGFEYLLIYQLDAFVFTDQLKYWCSKNYDYIGAPWLHPSDDKNLLQKYILHVKSLLYKRYNVSKDGIPNAKQLVKGVGNGGLSLRRVKKFYELCIQFKDMANEYINKEESEFNEDIFWSIALNRKKKHLKIPTYKIALRFSIETHPELAFRLNQNRQPFGCHAWDKHLNFWRPLLQKFNYKH